VSAPRVAIAGVVRRRQGIGEHLARFVVRHGGEVPAFLGSRPTSLEEGRAALTRHGIEARGFTDVGELLAACPVDALIIASPASTHLPYLEAARDAGLHVLCEKPVVWDVDDAPAVAERVVGEFAERDLLLWENAQWPFTVDAYRRLHPATADAPLRHFSMRLSPMLGGGLHMLRECMSHPLSLLQTLAPVSADGLQGLSFSTRDPDCERIEVSFRYPGGPSGVAVRVELAAVPEQPRPASYGVNGLVAERRVRLEDYALSFHHGDRSEPVPDPTDALVAAFVGVLRGEPAPDLPLSGPAVSWRARALEEIVTGFERVRARN
jgi:hypothetical protein